MILYIIRHAIAEEDPSGEDSQRALSKKGSKKMHQIAKGLRTLAVEFDLILSSPYVRSKETAEILADVFKMKKKIEYSDHLIPMGNPDLLIAEVNEKYVVDSLAIVGHEPYLTTLISLLTANDSTIDMTLKKGGVCVLSTDDLRHTRRATLEWLLTPGVLVELSEK